MDHALPPIGLTLGPVLFNWEPDRLRAFYRDIAQARLFDRVHLGEVVCGKRMPFSDPVWPDAIEALEAAGIEVVLSTLALPTTRRERTALAALCGEGDRLVEVNDLTALPSLKGRRFVVGPLMNVYNGETAAFLARQGATTICLPVELSLDAAAAVAKGCPAAEIELFAFGRLPLALSSRCYHARLHGLHKDSCRFVCGEDPDGLAVETLEGRPFLAANGIQTLSHGVQTYLATAQEARALGLRRLRLSPHTIDMNRVARLYRAVIEGETSRAAVIGALARLALPGELVHGYLTGEPGCTPLRVL